MAEVRTSRCPSARSQGTIMKPVLYILELSNNQYYVGSTQNFDRRFYQHESGKVRSTKGKLPLKVVFQKEFTTLKQARQAEYKLKSYKNKQIIQQIIEDQQIKFMGA